MSIPRLVGSAVLTLSASQVRAVEPSNVAEITESTAGFVEQRAERMVSVGSEGDDVPMEEISVAVTSTLDDADFSFYGSARLRVTASDGSARLVDNFSRAGFVTHKLLSRKTELFARIELGIDVGGELEGLLIPGDFPPYGSSTVIFPRLGYAGVATSAGEWTVGKQWSTYYDVAAFTDKYAVYGGAGTGIYNAGTDGGATGTGRADRALQFRRNRGHWELAVQLQGRNEIPHGEGEKYDGAAGGSLLYQSDDGLALGLAFNQAFLEDHNESLEARGIHGDAQTIIIGADYVADAFRLAATFSWQKNHQTTDEQQYFDARGWELYSRYRFSERLRIVGGYNWLQPHRESATTGAYKVRNVIVGIQWTYGDIDFGDVLFFEAQISDGRLSSGAKSADSWSIGFRYSF